MFLNYDGPMMEVRLCGQCMGVCPITEERDYYTWQICYVPRNKLLEVVWLREELDKMGDNDEYITCEELAVFLKGVMDMIGPYQSEVVVWDESQGIQLEVKL